MANLESSASRDSASLRTDDGGGGVLHNGELGCVEGFEVDVVVAIDKSPSLCQTEH